ncbi:hypothetical protein FKB34_01800 [Glycocaulis profundi]|nr:hypothetical protein FKB34_01800 [Glycocaulis profundi]
MIRLDVAAAGSGPVWMEFPRMGGLSLLAHYADASTEAAARTAARRALPIKDEGEDLESWIVRARARLLSLGFERLSRMEDLDAALSGAMQVLYVQSLSRSLVEDWKGVGDVDGAPLDFSAEAMDALFLQYPDFIDQFDTRITRPLKMVREEGNGSAPSRNGSPAGARKSAGTARGKASAARKAAGSKTPSSPKTPRRSARRSKTNP